MLADEYGVGRKIIKRISNPLKLNLFISIITIYIIVCISIIMHVCNVVCLLCFTYIAGDFIYLLMLRPH